MFVARAGINSKGDSVNQQSGLTALLAPKRRKKQEFICWLPFMWRPCLGGLVGLLVFLGGVAMSVVGFYSKKLSTSQANNGTHTYDVINNNKRFHVNNLTYLGPVIMGCGCFVMVVACVVVCEARDRQVRQKIEEMKKKREARRDKKTSLYDTILAHVRRTASTGSVRADVTKTEDVIKVKGSDEKRRKTGRKKVRRERPKRSESDGTGLMTQTHRCDVISVTDADVTRQEQKTKTTKPAIRIETSDCDEPVTSPAQTNDVTATSAHKKCASDSCIVYVDDTDPIVTSAETSLTLDPSESGDAPSDVSTHQTSHSNTLNNTESDDVSCDSFNRSSTPNPQDALRPPDIRTIYSLVGGSRSTLVGGVMDSPDVLHDVMTPDDSDTYTANASDDGMAVIAYDDVTSAESFEAICESKTAAKTSALLRQYGGEPRASDVSIDEQVLAINEGTARANAISMDVFRLRQQHVTSPDEEQNEEQNKPEVAA